MRSSHTRFNIGSPDVDCSEFMEICASTLSTRSHPGKPIFLSESGTENAQLRLSSNIKEFM